MAASPSSTTRKTAPRKTSAVPLAAPPAVKRARAKAPAAPKTVAQTPVSAKVATPPVPPVLPKPEKQKKPKLVRDSFTIPKAEYAVLDDLKARAARLGTPAKKSELLRAGIKALASMADPALAAALAAVPAIKTGRPAKN